jgi:hypothetical protein
MHLYIHLRINFNANVIEKIYAIIITIINSGPKRGLVHAMRSSGPLPQVRYHGGEDGSVTKNEGQDIKFFQELL